MTPGKMFALALTFQSSGATHRPEPLWRIALASREAERIAAKCKPRKNRRRKGLGSSLETGKKV